MTPGSGAARDQAALDHPIWAALTTKHRALAEGGPLALRYPADIAPFAAMFDTSAAAYAALRALISPDGRVALFTTDQAVPAFGLETQLEAPIIQMIATDLVSATDLAVASGIAAGHILVGDADAPEMLQLAERTRPGPFGPRTHELGEFIGIRVDRELVAMAGERMRLDGFTEISAVCVHPDHRGKGYAQLLVRQLAHKLQQRGDTPFLHVFADNGAAIVLYQRLGFTVRRHLYVTVLKHASTSSLGT